MVSLLLSCVYVGKVPLHAIKAYKGSGSVAPFIQPQASVTFPAGKTTGCPLNFSGCLVHMKISYPCRDSNPDSPDLHQTMVAFTDTRSINRPLSWVSYIWETLTCYWYHVSHITQVAIIHNLNATTLIPLRSANRISWRNDAM